MENRYTAKITNYQIVENDKVVYFILVQDNIKGGVHTSRFRYSELKSYHDKVKKVLQEYHINNYDLPHFPGKKIFGKTNKNEESILERKNDIEYYINELISVKKLWSLKILEELIGSKDPEEINIDTFLRDEEQEKKEFKPPQTSKVQLGNYYRVNIESFCREEDTIKYFFKFYDMMNYETWETKFRYSELKGLHEAVSKEAKQLKQKLPQFPKSKIFGITNDDKQDIFNRRDQLQDYINYILADKVLLKLPVVQYFLQDSHLHSEGNELELRELQLKFLMKKLKMNREQTINIIRESGKKGFKALRSYVEDYVKIHNIQSNTTSVVSSQVNSVRSSVATLKPIQEDANQEILDEKNIYGQQKMQQNSQIQKVQKEQQFNMEQEEYKQQQQNNSNNNNIQNIQYQEVKF